MSRKRRSYDRFARFRFDDYKNALKKEGALVLHLIITHQKFKDLMDLLLELRNTIHGVGLYPVVYSKAGSKKKSM